MMAQEYASKQPQGFENHITKVAIVGVSWYSHILVALIHILKS